MGLKTAARSRRSPEKLRSTLCGKWIVKCNYHLLNENDSRLAERRFRRKRGYLTMNAGVVINLASDKEYKPLQRGGRGGCMMETVLYISIDFAKFSSFHCFMVGFKHRRI